MPRQAYRLKNLQLTKFRLNFPYHAPTRVVRKAWDAYNLKQKWAESAWNQKAESVKRVSISHHIALTKYPHRHYHDEPEIN